MEIILASQSPRRKELLTRMGLTFTVLPAEIEEVIEPGLTPQEAVMSLSRQKGSAVALSHPDALVIAADTIVVFDGRILGKPHSVAQAKEMLTALSGKTHHVCTGFTLWRGQQVETGCEESEVWFRELSEEEIDRYIATGEPMDKAGAYGIQGYGAMLVRGIHGDYFNVMGLPVCRLARLLARFGVDTLALAAEKEQTR